MTGKELLKLLEKNGWYVHRISGSHYMMRHPERPGVMIPVPVHTSEMPTGTMHKILKKAGLK